MPTRKLTAAFVKTIKPTDKTTEYFDTGRSMQGSFALRVSPKGRKSFLVMYSFNGRLRKMVLGTYPAMSLSEARKKAGQVANDAALGIDQQAVAQEYKVSETFSDLWGEYIKSPKYTKKAASSQKEEQRKYDKLLKNTIGPMKVIDIQRKHLALVLDDLAMESPVSANRLFSLLSFVLKFAYNKGLIDVHPMFGMDRPGGKEQARKRCLTRDEIAILWPAFENMGPTVCDIYRLILLTGQRPGEVMGIERGDIDLQAKTWLLPAAKTKTEQEHLIPLSEQALDIIKPRLEQGTRFLFPSHGKTGHTQHTAAQRYRLQRAKDKPWSEIPRWTAHDLRRTAATMLSKLGASDGLVDRILNHSLGKIRGTYNLNKKLAEKRIALDKLGREIDRITGTEQQGVIIKLRAV